MRQRRRQQRLDFHDDHEKVAQKKIVSMPKPEWASNPDIVRNVQRQILEHAKIHFEDNSLINKSVDLGKSGPNGDGVDGHWGPKMAAALADLPLELRTTFVNNATTQASQSSTYNQDLPQINSDILKQTGVDPGYAVRIVRAMFVAELRNNPDLKAQFAWRVKKESELFPGVGYTTIAETIMNRAYMRGLSLAEALQGNYWPKDERIPGYSDDPKVIAGIDKALTGTNHAYFGTGNGSAADDGHVVGFDGGPQTTEIRRTIKNTEYLEVVGIEKQDFDAMTRTNNPRKLPTVPAEPTPGQNPSTNQPAPQQFAQLHM